MELLQKILNDKGNRQEHIKQFQNQIWNDENSIEILRELAYDLDYYEQDEKLRSEDPSFYGEERLEREILTALQSLKKLNL